MTPSVADIELVEGCIKNDRRAQELLYKQFYGSMTSLCLRYTHNADDAIEVLHNGFLKVYKNIARFDPAKASLYTWIRTIIVHSAIDFLRQQEKFKNTVHIDITEEPSIDPDAIHRLSSVELLRLVQRLPAATQAVFNLYVIEGYNHREIGGLLGISEGTSKWHLSNARKQLQHLLETMQVVKP